MGIIVDRGVVIVEVEPGTSGQNAGLQPGDVILEVNRKKIKGIKDWREGAWHASISPNGKGRLNATPRLFEAPNRRSWRDPVLTPSGI